MERRGRPPSFSRSDLIAAARKIGPDAITLPALAAELGVARTSLYWHVRDRDEIGEVVLEAIFEETGGEWEPETGFSWDDVMASHARSVRRGLLAAGGWIRYATPRIALGHAKLHAINALVERLTESGFSVEEAARAYTYVFRVVLASIGSGDAPVTEMHRALASRFDQAAEDEDLETLRRVVELEARTSPEDQFEYELECTLRGIADHSGVRRGALPKRPRSPRSLS
jgi:AcrR family transcriptional regulator